MIDTSCVLCVAGVVAMSVCYVYYIFEPVSTRGTLKDLSAAVVDFTSGH